MTPPNRPFIVGISGPAGAGKTTLASNLRNHIADSDRNLSVSVCRGLDERVLQPHMMLSKQRDNPFAIIFIDGVSTPQQRAACDYCVWVEEDEATLDRGQKLDADIQLVRCDSEYTEILGWDQDTPDSLYPDLLDITIPAIAERVLAAWREWMEKK